MSSEDNEDDKKPMNKVSKEGLQANEQSPGNNLTKDCYQIESIIRNAASQFFSNLTKDCSINTLIDPIASQFASKIVDELKNKIPEQTKKDEIKRINEIDFAMHELSDNTALTITIIIGIFGVLTLFVSSGSGAQDIEQSVKPLWAYGLWWQVGKEMILSVTYWTLILFGLKCYVDRRIFFILKDDLIKDAGINYSKDLIKRANCRWLTRISVNHTWATYGEEMKKFRYKADIHIFTVFYLVIAFLLWFFIANPLVWFFPLK
jgi:hypothetical protein